MGKTIYKVVFYTLILAVYGVFFSIESFYNFEGHSEAREIIRYSSYLHTQLPDAGVKAPHAAYPQPHKVHLRLNKRYHGEEFPPCTVYEAPAPQVISAPRIPGIFCLALLPSVPLVHPQLRGPPFAGQFPTA